MAHFSNFAINRLNLHSALHMFGLSVCGNFLVAFLLSRGLSLRDILAFAFALLAGRFALRPLVLRLARKFGVVNVLRLGAAAFALQYLSMSFVTGIDVTLISFGALTSLSDVLYWVAYHALFAERADGEHRAQQIGVREAASAAVGVLAPLLAGGALDRLGPKATFGLAALIELFALVPLIGVPDFKVEDQPAPQWVRRIRAGAVIFATDGWITMGGGLAWMAALFEASSRSFVGFGGLISLGALLASLGGVWLGKFVDSGHAARLAVANGGLLVVCIMARVAGAWDAEAAYVAALMGPVLLGGYVQMLMTAVYGAVAASGCPLRATIATEGAWDLGGAAACLVGMGLLALGAGPGWIIATAAPAAVLQTALLWRRYAAASQRADPR